MSASTLAGIDRGYITEVANRMDFVVWDRTVVFEELSHAMLYGWIARDDGRFDFVVLWFWFDGEPQWTFVTSSARYSPLLQEMQDPETEHNDCRVAATELPGLAAAVDRSAG